MTIKKYVVASAVAAIMAGTAIAPSASAQEQTSKQDCYNGVFWQTVMPVVNRTIEITDPNTGLPYPTVEAVIERTALAFALYPAISSYVAGITLHCEPSS